MIASFDNPIQETAADEICLFLSPRGVFENIKPHLKNIARSDAAWPNHSTKNGLGKRRLANDHVGRLARRNGYEVLPR
ncbi:MAG: hypothetical protein A3I61_16945 [Acidobacteria bacterium RIFCSPLOWO2_02_FULL_68_18]|nr:MAG: hypothetical protein A3I61_16945 [Acidobacteria bacterium RIFCSPLOWO2_02_FULL_68_18]OFW50142.1 MAG: hypothetical protein A3G77_09320 [Acidobacteria bacterium RIFCSPLOWO2_12_FULL_68_19]